MNKREVAQILTVLKVAYPGFYSMLTKSDVENMVNVWADFFKNEPYEVVEAAVKSIINAGTKDGYPPDIGAVKEQIRRFLRPEKDTAMTAWNEVRKAISFYNARETFNSLSELSRKIVGSPNQLRDWALMEMEMINTVVQSNFLRAYRAMEQEYLARQALPEDVKRIVEQIQKGMMLNGPDSPKDELEAKAEFSQAGQIAAAGYETGNSAEGTDPGVSHQSEVAR